jgi:hypothetical protein
LPVRLLSRDRSGGEERGGEIVIVARARDQTNTSHEHEHANCERNAK